MATHYPSERDEWRFISGILQDKIKELEEKNKELNIALMRSQAKEAEAREELKRCKLEWEIVADQGLGHNSCHAAISRALKNTIGHTGKYPDPDNITAEQFAHGCVSWHSDIFPGCGIRLAIVREAESE